MIRRSRAQSSSLFLMELILAILFFSVTSAVCVQFFVKSHLLSRDSRILSQAVNECSNIAELAVSSDSIEGAFSLLGANYPDAEAGAAYEAFLYYDDTFSPCGREEASYTLKAAFTNEDTMLRAAVQVTASDGSEIYRLDASHHTARRTDDEKR